ncbi:hypothetical protein GCM10027514_14640 [Azotobacter armeniacus]
MDFRVFGDVCRQQRRRPGGPAFPHPPSSISRDDIDAAGSDKREWERDFRVDYRVQDGLFKGISLSWLNAAAPGNDSRDLNENRLVVSYTCRRARRRPAAYSSAPRTTAATRSTSSSGISG